MVSCDSRSVAGRCRERRRFALAVVAELKPRLLLPNISLLGWVIGRYLPVIRLHVSKWNLLGKNANAPREEILRRTRQ